MACKLSFLVAALLALAPGQGLPLTKPITVSAAVSLTESLTAVAEAYARTGATVRFNFAASNILARQIVNGAPVDVFISADEAQMDVVAAAGLVKDGSRAPGTSGGGRRPDARTADGSDRA